MDKTLLELLSAKRIVPSFNENLVPICCLGCPMNQDRSCSHGCSSGEVCTPAVTESNKLLLGSWANVNICGEMVATDVYSRVQTVLFLLLRLDKLLTGKDDQTVKHTQHNAKHHLLKLLLSYDDEYLYYLSDGGYSRIYLSFYSLDDFSRVAVNLDSVSRVEIKERWRDHPEAYALRHQLEMMLMALRERHEEDPKSVELARNMG